MTEARPAGTTTYSYDAADRLTASSGLVAQSFTYDRNGNQTSAGARTLAWGQDGRLTSTTLGSGTTTYAYDGRGKRASATLGSDTTKFTWDVVRPLPELVLERDGSGALKRRYLYGRDLLQMTTEGSDYAYHHDALGSVGALTSGSGEKVAGYLYEPFGGGRPVTPVNPSLPDNPMGFTGEYLDPTGLYHLRARQYDGGTGLFLAKDPLPPPLAKAFVSPFAYAENRPTYLVDPTGLRGQCAVAGYLDTNVSIGFVTGGTYVDECGERHWYVGFGLGLPGVSVAYSPYHVSCESSGFQGFYGVGGSLGGGIPRGGSVGDEEFYGEVGLGTPQAGWFKTWTSGC